MTELHFTMAIAQRRMDQSALASDIAIMNKILEKINNVNEITSTELCNPLTSKANQDRILGKVIQDLKHNSTKIFVESI
ncbi:7362_t:CDS:2, partial [Diversispora eburnea]